MCVWTSINPGNPVYFERSTISAPEGISDASVVTLRVRSPSTITIAFVHSFPLASHNFPKRTALTALASGFAWARRPLTQNARRRTATHVRMSFIRETLRMRRHFRRKERLLIQLWQECNRETVEIYCWRRAVCAAEDFPVEELVGGSGGATPAVCEPRPNCCSVFASSFPLGFSPCAS